MDAILRNYFGAESSERQQFTSAASWGGMVTGSTKAVRDENRNKRFERVLQSTSAWLDALIFQVETFGLRSDPGIPDEQTTPNVFIAHGGDSQALNKLCAFLQDDLGVKPLVVERLPSEGRSVNENVEHYLGIADAAIVLATGDDFVDGRYQARGNVQIELGRFQERFPERVIFLLEKGAAYPSNVSEKVWERFTQGNMEKALKKVVRELRAFGFLGNPRS